MIARRVIVAFATLLGVAALTPSIPPMASAMPRTASAGSGTTPRAIALSTSPAQILAQDDDSGDNATADKGASPEQIEKYVAVYRAMQRNHSVTVEQAAASQGLTVGAFRDLERRIESDDLARDDARNALAAPAQGAAPAATPKAQR